MDFTLTCTLSSTAGNRVCVDVATILPFYPTTVSPGMTADCANVQPSPTPTVSPSPMSTPSVSPSSPADIAHLLALIANLTMEVAELQGANQDLTYALGNTTHELGTALANASILYASLTDCQADGVACHAGWSALQANVTGESAELRSALAGAVSCVGAQCLTSSVDDAVARIHQLESNAAACNTALTDAQAAVADLTAQVSGQCADAGTDVDAVDFPGTVVNGSCRCLGKDVPRAGVWSSSSSSSGSDAGQEADSGVGGLNMTFLALAAVGGLLGVVGVAVLVRARSRGATEAPLGKPAPVHANPHGVRYVDDARFAASP